MKKSFALLFGLFLSIGFALPTQAQDAKVDKIIDAYFETIGGKENWAKVDKMRFEGNSVTQGMELETSVISMRPNLQKVVVAFQDKQFIDAFDGTTAWSINPFMGGLDPQKKTEEESKEAAENRFEDELLNYEEKGYTITYEGTEEVEGTKADVLRLVKANGDETFYFMDAELNIPVMIRNFAKSGPMKGQPVETYFSDYDEVSFGEGTSLIVAHTIEQKMAGQTFMTMTANNIELNPSDISESDFAFPGDK